MNRRPPRHTLTYTLFPYTTLFRSKATMEVEAVDEGTIAKIVVPEGTDGVKVGAVIAMLAEDGEDAASVAAPGGGDTAEADDEGAKAQPKGEQPAEEAPAAPESPTPHKVETGARKMYDAARHAAEVERKSVV